MLHPLLLAALFQGEAAPPLIELSLSCPARGAAVVPVETTTAVASDNSGNRASADAVRSQAVAINGVVSFRLRDGRATLTIPAQFLPPAHGGNDGQFDVRELQITDREISGKVKVNFLYSSRFRIDRISGRLSTSGGLEGMCEAEDPTHRKF